MKKLTNSLVIIIAIFISANTTDAQSYQPFPTESAKWEVARCWYFYPAGWYDKYTLTMDGTDTLYDGEIFKKIYIANHHLPGTIHDSIYPTEFFGGLRESGKQIFIWQKWASTDTSVQLVYDFNKTNIGDTIYTNVLSGNPNLFGHVVTDTDSVLIGNQFHKRLHLQDPYNEFNTEFWIEGVGSSWGLPFATFWSATDNSYDLTCFSKDQRLQYENPNPGYGYCQAPLPMITCENVPTSTDEKPGQTQFSNLYPNPASDVITLDFDHSKNKSLKLYFYNIAGVLVRSEAVDRNQVQLDISGLSNGIYFVVLKSEDLVEINRFIVQR